jgi:diketogulonate reductase-like aldo/keto reductase
LIKYYTLSQKPLFDYCQKYNISLEAWRPLGGSEGNLLNDKSLKAIADKYDKSIAQVILRWDLQRGIITIPKSVHRERIIANADLYDFELSADDMSIIGAMNENRRFGPNPDNFNF